MSYLLDCPGCWYDYQTPLAQQPTSKQLEALTAIQKNLEHLWVTESNPDWYTVFVDTQLLAALNLAKPASIHGLYVRAGFAVRNLLSKALLFERNITRKFGAKHAKSLPRWQMLNAAAESKSLLSWDSNPIQLRTALVQTLRSDPSPYVRLEALRAIGAAPIPLSWTGPLLEAIQGAEATLAETPFTQAERQALAKYLADVTSKLQAAAAPSFPAVTVPGISEPVTTLDLQLAPIDPNSRAWLPWALGGSLGLLAIVGALVYQRSQARRE